MEFYVFRIRYQNDGTVRKSEVITKNSLREAEAKCHTNLGEDMNDSTLSGGICMAVSENGDIVLKVKWGQKTIIETE